MTDPTTSPEPELAPKLDDWSDHHAKWAHPLNERVSADEFAAAMTAMREAAEADAAMKPAPPIEAAAEPDDGEMTYAEAIGRLVALAEATATNLEFLTATVSALTQRVQVLEAHEHGAKASIV